MDCQVQFSTSTQHNLDLETLSLASRPTLSLPHLAVHSSNLLSPGLLLKQLWTRSPAKRAVLQLGLKCHRSLQLSLNWPNCDGVPSLRQRRKSRHPKGTPLQGTWEAQHRKCPTILFRCHNSLVTMPRMSKQVLQSNPRWTLTARLRPQLSLHTLFTALASPSFLLVKRYSHRAVLMKPRRRGPPFARG